MRVKVTTTKVKDNRHAQMVDYAQTIFIEAQELVFRPNGTVLEIYNPMSGAIYLTDQAYSGVATILESAATTGGSFTLT